MIRRTVLLIVAVAMILDPIVLLAKKKGKDSKEVEETKSPKASSNSFGVNPPEINMIVKPGETVTASIKVANPGKTDMDIYLSRVGFQLNKDGLQQKAINLLPADNIARHIRIESEQVIVPPRSYKDVLLTIGLPATATGTQYAAINVANATPTPWDFETRKEEYSTQIGVGFRPAINVVVKIHADGTLKYGYALAGVKFISQDGNAPPQFQATFQNTGNTELGFSSIMILMNDSTKSIFRLKAERPCTMLPAGSAQVTFPPTFQTIPPGNYKVMISSVARGGVKMSLPPLESKLTVK